MRMKGLTRPANQSTSFCPETQAGTPTAAIQARAAALLVLALSIGGCGLLQPELRGPAAVPLDWPEGVSATPETIVLPIERAESQIRIRVDPAGPLARLGHSHVIGGAVLEGHVLLGEALEHSQVDLELEVAALEVDRPDWRAEAGLEPDLDPEAVAGTRANMLGPRVLDANGFPRIALRSTALRHDADGWRIEARIRLQDRIHALELPLQLRLEGERLIASGEFETRHAELGLAPFSAAGGALRVADPIRIRFRIAAVVRADDVAIIRKLITPITGRP